MPEQQQPRRDVDSEDVVTKALLDLVNEYPALKPKETIAFSVLNENSGRAFFPTTGAVIEQEERDIIGRVYQTCAYPFILIYRSGRLTEARRLNVKEWLDDLGRWLEKQTITVNGTAYTLSAYPTLTGNRAFKTIGRQTPAYCYGMDENGTEDWAINIVARYTNNF